MVYCLETMFKLLGTWVTWRLQVLWQLTFFVLAKSCIFYPFGVVWLFLKKSWEIMHPKTHKMHWGYGFPCYCCHILYGFPTKQLSKSNHQWLQSRVVTPFPVDLVSWPRRQDDYLYKTHSGFFLQSGNQARHQGKTFFMVPLFHGFFGTWKKP